MRILLVEDDELLGSGLRAGLAQHGFSVDWVRDGVAAERELLTGNHQAAVLDLGLPRQDGMDTLRTVRAQNIRTPVLILTARDAVDARIGGLDGGADDYLVKPFSFAELLARARTILRRGRNGTEVTVLQVADLELDLLRRRVSRSGKRIDLTAKEFGLLELLMRRQGEVLPRSLIASQVWDMNFDSDSNVIEVAMRRLRAKIDDAYDAKLIQTVRGMGYVLEAPQERA